MWSLRVNRKTKRYSVLWGKMWQHGFPFQALIQDLPDRNTLSSPSA